MFLAYSSGGVVYSLQGGMPFGAAATSWHWSPLLDTTTHPMVAKKGLMAWVIGVDMDKLLCVLCKATTPEPKANPKPVQTTMPLAVPLCGRNAANEDSLLRKRVYLQQLQWCLSSGVDVWTDDCPEKVGLSLDAVALAVQGQDALVQEEKDMDKALLRQFQAACKEEKDARAYDLATRLCMPASVDIAVKVAQQSRRTALAQALYKAKPFLAANSMATSAMIEPMAMPAPQPPRAAAAVVSPVLPDLPFPAASAPVVKTPAKAPSSSMDLPPPSMKAPAKASPEVVLPPKTTPSAAAKAAPTSPTKAKANPFAKTVTSSPSKKRNPFEALVTASPPTKKAATGAMLQRQSTFAIDGAASAFRVSCERAIAIRVMRVCCGCGCSAQPTPARHEPAPVTRPPPLWHFRLRLCFSILVLLLHAVIIFTVLHRTIGHSHEQLHSTAAHKLCAEVLPRPPAACVACRTS